MTPPKAFWLFVGFAIFVFLTGGGSRFDIDSIGVLRAGAALVLAAAVFSHSTDSFRPVAGVVALLALLALWMAVQSIPLPPDMWTALPERAAIAEIGDLVGLAEAWRPITLSPQRTLNSLASLVVPIAALLLIAHLDREGIRRSVALVVWIGVASAVMGIAQIALPNADGLYLYEITNADSAVGLFSNRNHNALFLNIALLFSLFVRPAPDTKRKDAKQLGVIMMAARALIVVAILINASRFGILMLAGVGAIYFFQSFRAWKAKRENGSTSRGALIATAGTAIGVVVLGAFFALTDRIPALERFSGQDLADDQRTEALPYVVELAQTYFPFGTGFGAFEQAYRNIEPTEFLSPRYLNHAHNDWMQIFVEGGLPIAIIVIAALVMLARHGLVLWTERGERGVARSFPLLGILTVFMIALHSAFDYPLRTPSIMLVAVLACGLLVLPAAGGGIKRLRG